MSYTRYIVSYFLINLTMIRYDFERLAIIAVIGDGSVWTKVTQFVEVTAK